jgi:hypothetical protein
MIKVLWASETRSHHPTLPNFLIGSKSSTQASRSEWTVDEAIQKDLETLSDKDRRLGFTGAGLVGGYIILHRPLRSYASLLPQ